MQAIAEAYDLLWRGLGLPAERVAGIFAEWNRGPLESYLLDVTAQVLAAPDPETGNPLVEMILDQAGQKGTGKWTAQSALDLGVAIPTIAAAIDARILSSMKGERVTASTQIHSETTARVIGEPREMTAAVHDALRATTVCAYAQGMSLLRVGSGEYGWKVELREIARIWKGGCIIRARLLDTLMQAFERVPDLPNLLLDADVRPWLSEAERGWRRTVSAAVAAGIPAPAMSTALAYFDGYRSARLPTPSFSSGSRSPLPGTSTGCGTSTPLSGLTIGFMPLEELLYAAAFGMYRSGHGRGGHGHGGSGGHDHGRSEGEGSGHGAGNPWEGRG